MKALSSTTWNSSLRFMFRYKLLMLFISRFEWILWALWSFFNFVTSAISTNQNNVRLNQCHSNKTNICTLSNQCSITTTVYLQNSTLIQRSMFLITIYRKQIFITLEINVQKISTRSKLTSRNIITATSK